ncbi:Hypothetical protein D9617_12g037740 [Elsinoe fawcettii]|nr:Hypothetical protein D9617_12g037740 [Elsinoe fawcettii]
MDSRYQVVKTVQRIGATAAMDMHEFRITPHSNSTTALATIYQPRMLDLTASERFRKAGPAYWILDGLFQEIDLESGEALFVWSASDFIDPSQSYTYFPDLDYLGDGLSSQSPWDFFHINSVDKNVEGDYLISARHTYAIYKISSKDGHVIWQLGGMNSTFELQDFIFSSQHHARWLSENATHTVLSLFDNGGNTVLRTSDTSTGMVVEIDHVAGTASVVRQWQPPYEGLFAESQGGLQILSNRNVHIDWGSVACYSEHTWDGRLVQVGKLRQDGNNIANYRSHKFNWTAEPASEPAVWTYAHNESAPMVFYVSWNGATEVRRWIFYASEDKNGPYEKLGEVEKHDFESVWQYRATAKKWAYAEAVNADGRALQVQQQQHNVSVEI